MAPRGPPDLMHGDLADERRHGRRCEALRQEQWPGTGVANQDHDGEVTDSRSPNSVSRHRAPIPAGPGRRVRDRPRDLQLSDTSPTSVRQYQKPGTVTSSNAGRWYATRRHYDPNRLVTVKPRRGGDERGQYGRSHQWVSLLDFFWGRPLSEPPDRSHRDAVMILHAAADGPTFSKLEQKNSGLRRRHASKSPSMNQT